MAMWQNWGPAILGALVAVSLFVLSGPALYAGDGYYGEYGYRDFGLGNLYYGDYDRDLQYRPRFHQSRIPPPPDFGPALPNFPHDVRISGANWHLFSPRFKGFPRWSGYNDTYPRGTGTESFFIRPDQLY